jgi:hypothetical protein
MGFRQSVSAFRTRLANALPRYNRRYVNDAVKTAEDVMKRRRGTVTQQYIEEVDKIVDQPWPYTLLKKYANRHPFLRIVHGAIIREVVRNRWEVVEKFAMRCTCGREFPDPVTECPDCHEQGVLRGPNPQEKQALERFLDRPNRDDELIDLIKSCLKDNLSVDDWYLSVVEVAPNQYALYVEDAGEMFICADKHGRLGNGVYFCPTCWEPEQHEKIYPDTQKTCPYCGGDLTETAYVQKQAGTIKARFGRHEIIHGNSDPWLPPLYGNSKVMAILTELRSALAMQSFNFDTYASGHLAKIITMEGEEQTKATEIAKAAKEQADQIEIDSWTGRIGRKVRNLFLGAHGKIDVHDVMPDPTKMQSLEWMEFWFVKITGAIYGVQPVMINAPTRGPGGYFQRMQVVVQNDTTRGEQAMFEDAFNEQFVEEILGIHDWRFQFVEIEPRNELEQAQIWQSKVAAGTLAVEAGLNAELTDEGELKISGVFQKPEVPSQATGYLMPKPPKAPEAQQSPPFAMDKIKVKGKRWLVTEVEDTEAETPP